MKTPVDLSALAKWPNVPACYDWLSLDRRGDWRLRGERVVHHGLIALLNRQYGVDERGCWFVQNGPQRVFVELAYMPWIFRRAEAGFVGHTGEAAGQVKAVYLDGEGSVLLETTLGVGLLDDRDLAGFIAECCHADGLPAGDEALIYLMETGQGDIRWRNRPLLSIAAAGLAERFAFNPRPQPEA